MYALLLFVSLPHSIRSELGIVRVPMNYPTIQGAIDAVPSGGTILVSEGIYDGNISISKSLTIIGENQRTTIIDGVNNGTTVFIGANNVAVDGFTICNGSYGGVRIYASNSVNVTECVITHSYLFDISIEKSSEVTISKNIIPSVVASEGMVRGDGMFLSEADHCLISGNVISNVITGITSRYSTDNTFIDNTVDGEFSWMIEYSNNTQFYHNLFMRGISSTGSNVNVSWCNGTVGNYWNDYSGVDDGSNGRLMGDGIGDTDLPSRGVDNYPLINPPFPIPLVWESSAYPVAFESNSTISAFDFVWSFYKLSFNVTGPENTTGFFNVTIPKSLLNGNPWTIRLDGNIANNLAKFSQNETHTSIYLEYDHSVHTVQLRGTTVVPEFYVANPISLILGLSSISLIIAVTAKRVRYKNRRKT